MESENILPLVMDKCRICMEHNGTINIFGRRNLPEDIRLCTSVKIREDDLLPKIICISCRRSIQKAMKLRRTALDTNAKMRFVGGLTKDLEIPNVYRTSRDKKQKRSSRHVEADSQTKDSKRDQIPKLKIVMTNGTGHSAELTHVRCKEEDMGISQGTAHSATDRFICEICSRKCPSRYSLYLHSRWHDDSKKLHCPLCQKSCISKSDLRKHNRTHTGEKPFTCDVCERSFSQNSTLKAHKLTHSKKKN